MQIVKVFVMLQNTISANMVKCPWEKVLVFVTIKFHMQTLCLSAEVNIYANIRFKCEKVKPVFVMFETSVHLSSSKLGPKSRNN